MIKNMLAAGSVHYISVKPNSASNEIFLQDDKIVVKLVAPPNENRANVALVKLFKKTLGVRIQIIKGQKSKIKLIEVI